MKGRRLTRTAAPAAVLDTIAQLGRHVAAARLRRRWTQEELAQKAGISRLTLRNLEAGAPGTSIAVCTAVLWAMGLHHPIAAFASLAQDPEGAALEEARLGRRARRGAALDDNF